MVGAGDLIIESGGMGGPAKFTDVRHPDTVQVIIHDAIEENARGLNPTRPRRPPPTAAAAGSSPIRRHHLRRFPMSPSSSSGSRGSAARHHHQGRVRRAEGQAARAVVRVVSLVPSVTETLLAWGLEPVGVTRFCEQPGLRAVGGTKDPDIDAIVALAPDLVVVNDEENRREDAGRVGRGRSGGARDPRALGRRRRALPRRPCGRRRRPPPPSLPGAAPTGPRPLASRWKPNDVVRTSRRRVRPDLATAVDDDERRHLRLVGAGRAGHRQRVRRRGRALSDDDPRRRRRPAARAGAGADRALPLQGAPPPGAPLGCARRPGSSTVRTCSGGATARPLALERLAQALGS